MKNMHKDMQTRFSNLINLDIPTRVSFSFELNVCRIDISLKEPLIELQSNKILRAKFNNGKYTIWIANDVATKYLLLWNEAQLYVIGFPSSYLVKSGFSSVSDLLSKVRNKLDIVKNRRSSTVVNLDGSRYKETH